MHGVLSGVAGRSPVAASSSSSSSTPGTIARASQSSSCTAPARTAVSVPALLDRGADDDRAVAARHEVHGAPVHEAAHRAGQQRDGGGGVRRAEAQDVALDGAEGGQPGAGEPVDGGEAGPGRQDDVVRAEAAAVRQDQRRTGVRAGDHGLFTERDAAAAAGRGERAEQRPVVDLVVARDLDAAAQRRGSARGRAGGTRWRCGGTASRPSVCW